MSIRQKTYVDGVRESIEILASLKDSAEKENNAYFLVENFIRDKDNYYDKVGKKIEVGDFLEVNPEDDSWLDLVIRFGGNLIFVSEFTSNEPVRLSDVLQGSDNPAIIVGNLYKHRIEFHEF